MIIFEFFNLGITFFANYEHGIDIWRKFDIPCSSVGMGMFNHFFYSIVEDSHVFFVILIYGRYVREEPVVMVR
jgi:hypothetical protein